MGTMTLFRGSTGLNTRHDPVRLDLDEDAVKGGIRQLARAVNVVVDDTGRVDRVKGFSQLLAGNCHSLFVGIDDVLVVKDDWLCRLAPDFSTAVPLRELSPGMRVSYAEIFGRVYYTNGREQGYVAGGADNVWIMDEYTGPDTDKVFSGPPLGHLLEYQNGHLYVASEDRVYISERFYPGLFWLAGRFLSFEGRVSLLAGVADGMWIGDGRGIYWLAGLDPDAQELAQKTSYSVIEGTACRVPPEALPYDNLTGAGEVVKVGTAQGLCLLGPSGFFVNETYVKINPDQSPYLFQGALGAGGIFEGAYVYTVEP